MIDHLDAQMAARARLTALLVCTTGVTSLSTTTSGYARATGSFTDEGFAKGMELRGSGFSNAVNNGVGVITRVTPLALTVAMFVISYAGAVRSVTRPANVVEADAGGRSLAVGLPSLVAWENTDFVKEPGVPYADEQYVRGPAGMTTIGPLGRILGEPMYLPRIYVPSNSGITASSRYADAVVNAYPPGDRINLGNGNVLEVRADAAPYGGQLLQGDPGFAGQLCTIPLRVQSINSI